MCWLLNSNYKKGTDGATLKFGWIQGHRVLPSLSSSSPPHISVWACIIASLSVYNGPHTLEIWPQATQAYIPLATQTRLQKKRIVSLHQSSEKREGSGWPKVNRVPIPGPVTWLEEE